MSWKLITFSGTTDYYTPSPSPSSVNNSGEGGNYALAYVVAYTGSTSTFTPSSSNCIGKFWVWEGRTLGALGSRSAGSNSSVYFKFDYLALGVAPDQYGGEYSSPQYMSIYDGAPYANASAVTQDGVNFYPETWGDLQHPLIDEHALTSRLTSRSFSDWIKTAFPSPEEPRITYADAAGAGYTIHKHNDGDSNIPYRYVSWNFWEFGPVPYFQGTDVPSSADTILDNTNTTTSVMGYTPGMGMNAGGGLSGVTPVLYTKYPTSDSYRIHRIASAGRGKYDYKIQFSGFQGYDKAQISLVYRVGSNSTTAPIAASYIFNVVGKGNSRSGSTTATTSFYVAMAPNNAQYPLKYNGQTAYLHGKVRKLAYVSRSGDTMAWSDWTDLYPSSSSVSLQNTGNTNQPTLTVYFPERNIPITFSIKYSIKRARGITGNSYSFNTTFLFRGRNQLSGSTVSRYISKGFTPAGIGSATAYTSSAITETVTVPERYVWGTITFSSGTCYMNSGQNTTATSCNWTTYEIGSEGTTIPATISVTFTS